MIRRGIIALSVIGASLGMVASSVTAALYLTAAPALARPLPPPVYTVIDGDHGRLTTPSPLHKGQVLRFFGYFTGTATVTSVHASGPLDVITLSPGLPSSLDGLVLDAH